MYFILDTNVFIHFKLFNQVDWSQELGLGDIVFAISPSVIRELDHKKNHPDKFLSSKSKTVISHIDMALENGQFKIAGRVIPVVLVRTRPERDWLQANNLSETIPDDVILAEAAALVDSDSSIQVTVVSSDLGMKLKARDVGIAYHRIDEALRVESKDPRDKELNDLKAKLHKLEQAAPVLEARFSTGEKVLDVCIQPLTGLDNSALEAEIAAEDSKRPYKKPDTPQVTVTSLFEPKVGNPIEDERWEKYMTDFREYLIKKYNMMEILSQTIQVNIDILNSGTKPASDIDVTLSVPEGIFLLSEENYLELMHPEPPERPVSQIEQLTNSLKMPMVSPYGYYGPPKPYKLSPGKHWKVDPNRGIAYVHIKALRNRDSVEMAPLVCFHDKDHKFDSFSIKYDIEAGLPESFSGKLHVKVATSQ